MPLSLRRTHDVAGSTTHSDLRSCRRSVRVGGRVARATSSRIRTDRVRFAGLSGSIRPVVYPGGAGMVHLRTVFNKDMTDMMTMLPDMCASGTTTWRRGSRTRKDYRARVDKGELTHDQANAELHAKRDGLMNLVPLFWQRSEMELGAPRRRSTRRAARPLQ